MKVPGALLLLFHLSPGLYLPLPAQESARPLPQDQGRDRFVSRLLQRKTLKEKTGQLNRVSIGFDVTGPVVSQEVHEDIRRDRVGGVFNSYTPVAARKLQQMAVKQSRLGYPDQNLQHIYEPGDFKVFAGPSSRDVQELALTFLNP